MLKTVILHKLIKINGSYKFENNIIKIFECIETKK